MSGSADGHGARARRAVESHGLWLTAVLAVAAFAGMVAYADADRVAAALASFEWSAFLAILGLSTAGYFLRFLKWSLYLRELDVDVPAGRSLLVFFSGLMMVVTPGKTGEVWKAWFLRDLEGVPVSKTTSVVGAERATDLLALGLLALLGIVVYGRSSALLVAAGVAFVVGLGLVQWRSFCRGVLARVESVPVLGRYATDIEEFYESTYALFRPRPLVLATLVSVLAWGLEGLALWLAIGGFGGEASVLVALFVFGFGSVVGAVSMLPGGLLATEASMVSLLVSFGYGQSVAVGATAIVRVGTLWYAAVLGVVVFSSYKLHTATVTG